MTKNFADVGVKYSLGGKTGNTLDSHRLATWVKDKHGLKKQDEVMTAMFQAYFSDEKFLGDRGVLVAAAESAGLSGDDARAPPCPRPPRARGWAPRGSRRRSSEAGGAGGAEVEERAARARRRARR